MLAHNARLGGRLGFDSVKKSTLSILDGPGFVCCVL